MFQSHYSLIQTFYESEGQALETGEFQSHYSLIQTINLCADEISILSVSIPL